jgi:hypothetical protein
MGHLGTGQLRTCTARFYSYDPLTDAPASSSANQTAPHQTGRASLTSASAVIGQSRIFPTSRAPCWQEGWLCHFPIDYAVGQIAASATMCATRERGWRRWRNSPTSSSQSRASSTLGRACALPSDTQGRSRVPELGSLRSVRGALSNGRPYRELVISQSKGQG